jgi:hypothetical protein
MRPIGYHFALAMTYLTHQSSTGLPLAFLQKIAAGVRDRVGQCFAILRRDGLKFILHPFREGYIDALFAQRFSAHAISVNHTQEITRMFLTGQ